MCAATLTGSPSPAVWRTIGREAFEDFLIEPNGTNTALIGTLDQAALHGAINRILALGLELVGAETAA